MKSNVLHGKALQQYRPVAAAPVNSASIPILPGTHISLLPLAPNHAAELFASASPALFEHLMQRPHEWSLAGFEALVGRLLSQPRESWVMVLNGPGPHAGKAIGHTSFLNIKPEHKTLEIGTTWIGGAFHGTAVNPESKLLLMRHAFEGLGYQRVEFLVSTRNLRSQAAVAKLGATREGVLRRRWLTPPPPFGDGTPRDVVIFGVTCDDWPEVRERLEARVAGLCGR